MGFFRKLKFWMKDEDLGLEDDLNIDPSTDMADQLGLEPGKGELLERTGESTVDQPLSLQKKSDFEEVPKQESFLSPNKDFELISSKLDTIKAELDAMNQRIQKIEKLAEKSSEKDKKKPVW